MQTTRFLVVIGAIAAVWASPLQTFAGPDNEAQAKMREAMRQKMEALSSQAAPAPTPAPAPKPVAAQPVVAPAPTVVVPVPVEPEPVKVVVPAPAPAPKPAKSDSRFTEVPTNGDDEATAKMRAALRQKLVADPAPAPAPVMVAPVKPAPPAKPVAPVAPVVTPAPAPAPTSVVAQPVPAKVEPVIAPAFSGSKQERLAALLQQYKADQISPQQYHAQRAAIIAEP